MSQVSSTRKLIGAGAIMASGTMISRILGVIRVMLVAFILGNGTRQADMLALATMVPNSLYILFAGGALNTVLVPQIVRAIKNDDDGGEAYTSRIMTAFMLIITVVAVVVTIGAPLVTAIYTSPAWRGTDLEAQYASLVALTYLTLPQIFFYGAFFLLGQVLNARDKFGPMMWAPIANNIISIAVMALYFVVWGNDDDHSSAFTTPQILLLGIGTTLGIVAQTAVMIPYIRKLGFKLRPRFDLKGTGLGHTFSLTKWTMGFVAVNQVGLMVVNRLATSATAGGSGAGVTVYANAHLLWILPHSLITVSLATAMLPNASRLAAGGDFSGVAGEFTKTVRLAMVAIVPATVAFLALSGPMAGLLFGQGTGATDAVWIAWALMAFALGLIPFTVQFVCLRTFYALENTRTPFFLQTLIAGLNIAGAIALVWWVNSDAWVAGALALAYSLAYSIGVLVTWQALRRRVPDLDGRALVMHLVRLLLGAGIGGVAAYYLSGWLIGVVPGRTVGQIVALAAGGLVILVSFLLMGKALKVKELGSLSELVGSRFGRRGGSRAGAVESSRDDRSQGDDQMPTAVVPALRDDMIDSFDTGPATVVRNKPATTKHTFPPVAGTPSAPSSVDEDTGRMAPLAPAGPRSAAVDWSDGGELAAGGEASDQDETTGALDIPGLFRDATPARIAAAGALLSTRYELVERLASLFGTETWRAHDQVLSRDVVVHVIAPGDPRISDVMLAARKGAVATDSRFLRVLDADEVLDPTQGIGAFVVREYAPGRSLTDILAAGPLSAIESAHIVRDLADALVAVHAQGLFHEQLSPDNVIITTSGAVRLGGFGVEAALADRADHQHAWSARESSDVVGLGKILYATLVRHWPGEAAFGMPAAPIVAGETAPAHTVKAGVSPALDRICTVTLTQRGAMSEPRISSAGQLVEALSMVLGTANAAADLEERVRGLDRAVPSPSGAPHDPFRRPGETRVGIWAPVSGTAPEEGTDVEAATLARSAGLSREGDGAGRPVLSDDLFTGPRRTPGDVVPPPVASTRVAGEDPDRPRTRRGVVALLALLVLIAVASIIALWTADPDQAATTPSGPGASSPAAQSQSPSVSQGAAGSPAIVGVRDFDPEEDGGNGEENGDRAATVIDGDAGTTWVTMRYLRRPDMGGQKPGVGLILDLGAPTTVTSATVTLVGGETAVELRVPSGSEPSMRTEADWTIVGSNPAATGTATIALDEPTETQYLMVYVTSLPPVEGGFRAEIAEVTLQ
ncbi:murein biosynthesis integral membrane protein MurJ [Tessaracoccus sp. MC1627]|uniref:murein biosynthesis integral membrane protein MurJ n=1 Tax=Tessaracoccus sp. MC1627 TaxID=2760312 RepID=UPI0015FFC14C|nr:murein biosynthesis integral membrane protein MurJ [Tessaracoccus sp. MC1627]